MLLNNGNDLLNDPYTNIHNPSAAKIPDVTHILNRTFGLVNLSNSTSF
jgi:hypothetical protein